MPKMTTIAQDELENLRERARKLAMEKSYLQIVNDLMMKLSAVAGLENTVDGITRLLLENIGGSNVSVYYQLDNDWYFADVYGNRRTLTGIDDDLAQASFVSRKFMETASDFEKTRMMTPEFTKASTWAMPLIVGQECIGVLKMNDMLMKAEEVRSQLKPFINYAALVLKNEILGQSRLQKAYDRIKITQFAVDHASDSMFWIRPDTRLANVNEAACRLLGYTRDELLGMTVFDVDPAFPREAWDAHWQEIKERRSFNIETQHKTKAGEVYPVEVSVNFVEYEGVEYNFAFARDISERKKAEEALRRTNEELEQRVRDRTAEQQHAVEQLHVELGERIRAEEALREKEAQLRTISNNLPGGYVYQVDLGVRSELRRFTYISSGVEKLHGVTVQQVLDNAMALYGLIHEDDRAIFAEKEAEAAASMATFRCDVRFRNGSQTQWLRIESSPHSTDDDHIVFDGVALDITERKQTEEKANQLAAIVESSDDAIIGKDSDGIITSWNPGAEKLYGYRSSEVIGKSITLLSLPGQESKILQILERIRSGEHIEHYETVRRSKDGGNIDISLTVSPIRDSGGKIIGASAIGRDITERKLAEEALRRVNRELRAISNCNQVLVRAEDEQALLNSICRIVCEEAGYRMAWVGYAEEDSARTVRPVAWAGVEDGYLAAAHITRADKERGRGPTGRAIRTGQYAYILDFATDPQVAAWREKALERGYRSSIAMPLKDEGERAFGAFTIYSSKPNAFTEEEVRLLEELAGDMAFGITTLRNREKRRKAEAELIKLFRAVEQSPVSIVITDIEGRIEFVNPKFSQVTGYEPDEALGRNPRILKTGHTSPEEYRHLWDTVSAGDMWEGEFLNKRKDGSLFWEHAIITPVRSIEGSITNYLAIKEDITERKKLEEQLLQAQKMESIGLLAGGVAHDFNNILTVINGYSSLLSMNSGLNEEQKKEIAEISSAAEKAAQLTHGLLAFSRKQTLVIKHEDLNDIVRYVHKFLARIIGEDIRFTSTCSETELPVLADKGQLEQVLLNLATNARDAMPRGGAFTISTDMVELASPLSIKTHLDRIPPGNYALLTVTDTGTGIKKEHLDHIFEPFFTTKEVGKGTGLGMSIIYGIVRQHNGFIDVDSDVGGGTTFRVYLPIDTSKHDDSGTDRKESAPPVGGSETILVAEDEPTVRTLLAKILSNFGYSLVLAEDGVDAIEKFRLHQDRIRLVLMDIIMPKKNGREACEEICGIKPGVKVLFTSGYSAEFIEGRGITDGAIELIKKPVNPMELLRKVKEMLNS